MRKTIDKPLRKHYMEEALKEAYEGIRQREGGPFGCVIVKDGKILSHKEGALRGIATRHGDPDDYWVNAGTNYTMDGFRMDVKEYMEQGERDTEKDAPISQIIGKYKGSQIQTEEMNDKKLYKKTV